MRGRPGVLRAVIADDEAGALRHLRTLLDACQVQTLAECATGGEVLEAVGRLRPDFVCLDILMPEIDGLQVARDLRPGVTVVFTTGYADYAVPAFDLDAADYLLKPLSAARVGEAVRRVRARLWRLRSEENPRSENALRGEGAATPAGAGVAVPRVVIPATDHCPALAPEAIRFIEARAGASVIHADGGTYRVRAPLDRLDHLLAPCGFLRTHRAYLVNLRRIRALVPWSRHVHSLLLDGGEETHVPVAKSRLAAFRRSVIWIPQTGGRRSGSGTAGEGSHRFGREPGPGPRDRRGAGG
ncbi:MAG: LytTR family DNA-binding domain-containing protein [Armatimonadota bacterium]|nr:LytTR family DNA-binding domain-containing protein [Armatimonadota bacterium]